MVGLIIAAVSTLVIIAAYIAFEVWITKRYGIPELPDEIKDLDARIQNEDVQLDLSLFTLHKEQHGRKTFRRTYESADGLWTLTLELDADIVVSYRAELKHNKTWWMNCRRENCSKTRKPKIILPGE